MPPMDPIELDQLARELHTWYRAGRWVWSDEGAPAHVPSSAEIAAKIEALAQRAHEALQPLQDEGRTFVGGPVRSGRLSVTVEWSEGLGWSYEVTLEALSQRLKAVPDLLVHLEEATP